MKKHQNKLANGNKNITWVLLKILAVGVMIFHIYLEIIFIFDWVILSEDIQLQELRYKKAYALFAPGIFVMESLIKGLSFLSPLLKFAFVIITIINTIATLFTLHIVFSIFKYKKWAAIITLLQVLAYSVIYIFN